MVPLMKLSHQKLVCWAIRLRECQRIFFLDIFMENSQPKVIPGEKPALMDILPENVALNEVPNLNKSISVHEELLAFPSEQPN